MLLKERKHQQYRLDDHVSFLKRNNLTNSEDTNFGRRRLFLQADDEVLIAYDSEDGGGSPKIHTSSGHHFYNRCNRSYRCLWRQHHFLSGRKRRFRLISFVWIFLISAYLLYHVAFLDLNKKTTTGAASFSDALAILSISTSINDTIASKAFAKPKKEKKKKKTASSSSYLDSQSRQHPRMVSLGIMDDGKNTINTISVKYDDGDYGLMKKKRHKAWPPHKSNSGSGTKTSRLDRPWDLNKHSDLSTSRDHSTIPDGNESINNSNNNDPNCVPMTKWQTTFHPTCNLFHELDFPYWHPFNTNSSHINSESDGDPLRYLGQGNYRIAWEAHPFLFDTSAVDSKSKVSNNDSDNGMGRGKSIVFKHWKYHYDFNPEMYKMNRVDSIVMDQLTFSPYVVDIYGLCGLSIFTEYAPGSLTKSMQKKSYLDKIKMMIHVAQGLADIHEINGGTNATIDHPQNQIHYSGVPAVIHNDLNTGHIIIGDHGLPKYNDFNIAIFRTWDNHTHEPCDFVNQHSSPQWRSPEEIFSFNDNFNNETAAAQQQQSQSNQIRHKLSEKVDIYALGNVFYRLAVGERPWRKGHGSINDESLKEIERLKYNGTKPPIPNKILDSNDPTLQLLLHMANKCYEFDPSKRPTAIEIVESLKHFVQLFERKQKILKKRLKPKK